MPDYRNNKCAKYLIYKIDKYKNRSVEFLFIFRLYIVRFFNVDVSHI